MCVLKGEKVTRKRMGEIVYSELLYYSYSEEQIADYIKIRKLINTSKT